MNFIVLEHYVAGGNFQRIIYHTKENRIIHQFRFGGTMKWDEDRYTSFPDANVLICNQYLPNINKEA